jgi:hypothetical protein
MGKHKKDLLDDSDLAAPGQMQLSLFKEVKSSASQAAGYTNAILVYDALPKYIWDSPRSCNDMSQAIVTRECKLSNNHLVVKVTAAPMEKICTSEEFQRLTGRLPTDKDVAPVIDQDKRLRFLPKSKQGTEIQKQYRTVVAMFPAEREEIIEDTIRHMVITGEAESCGNGLFYFRLSQLRDKLKRENHSMSLAEIKEALTLCNKVNLSIRSQDGSLSFSSSIFPLLAIGIEASKIREEVRRNAETDGDSPNGKRRAMIVSDPETWGCVVSFHHLVNFSIDNLRFRKMNYARGLTIKSPLARFLYKRMSLYWTQASPSHPYQFLLESMLSQAPAKTYGRIYEKQRAMVNALDALIKSSALESYEFEKIKEGRQWVNTAFKLVPHPSFVSDIISANWQAKINIKQAEGVSNPSLEDLADPIDGSLSQLPD